MKFSDTQLSHSIIHKLEAYGFTDIEMLVWEDEARIKAILTPEEWEEFTMVGERFAADQKQRQRLAMQVTYTLNAYADALFKTRDTAHNHLRNKVKKNPAKKHLLKRLSTGG